MSKQPFNYGGQAVLEGVMMRGSRALAVAVRNPAGEIVTHVEPLNKTLYSGPISRIPFVRGLTMIWDALGLGMRSLMFSAEVAMEEEEEVSFSGPVAWGVIVVALALGIGLFFVLPSLLAGLVDDWWVTENSGVSVVDNSLSTQDGVNGALDTEESVPVAEEEPDWVTSSLFSNLLEGLIRLLLFVGYVWLIGRMPDIKRVFAYHGAEHKTINAYEAGAELTPAAVGRFTTLHPRCGTAFLLSVMVISILLFSLLGRPTLWLRVLSRVVLIPVVAGVAYEYIRFSARHLDQAWMRVIATPNLAMQRLTTREPDSEMLEVAITAFNRMMAAEKAPLEEFEAQTSGMATL